MDQTKFVLLKPAFSKAVSCAIAPAPTTAAPLGKPLVFPTLNTVNSDKRTRVSLDKSRALDDQNKSSQKSEVARDHSLNGEKFDNKKDHQDPLNNAPRLAIKYMDDTLITTKIKALLMNVSVETQQGVVLLSGWVTRPNQLQQAERIALAVEGVKNVNNGLQVKRQTQWSASNRAGAPKVHRIKYE